MYPATSPEHVHTLCLLPAHPLPPACTPSASCLHTLCLLPASPRQTPAPCCAADGVLSIQWRRVLTSAVQLPPHPANRMNDFENVLQYIHQSQQVYLTFHIIIVHFLLVLAPFSRHTDLSPPIHTYNKHRHSQTCSCACKCALLCPLMCGCGQSIKNGETPKPPGFGRYDGTDYFGQPRKYQSKVTQLCVVARGFTEVETQSDSMSCCTIPQYSAIPVVLVGERFAGLVSRQRMLESGFCRAD